MKYRKTKKTFTSKQASEIIQSTLMAIESMQEAISTWQKNKPTGIIACVIVSEFGSVENAIEVNKKKIAWCEDKIQDLQRFL